MNEYIVEYADCVIRVIDEQALANVNHQLAKYDYVKIVRCRDCRHYRFVDRSDIFHDERHNDSFCLRFVGGKHMEVEPNGFCAWGERKNNDDR